MKTISDLFPFTILNNYNFSISLDEPGKPTGVEVTDWDKSHAELKWNKPENDGGAPITGYIVEYKQKFGVSHHLVYHFYFLCFSMLVKSCKY